MVHGAGEHFPGWSATRPAATRDGVLAAPQRQGQDEHPTGGGLHPVAQGRGEGAFLVQFAMQATTITSCRARQRKRLHCYSCSSLAAGALLPAGSTANRLLLGSDLPRAHLGGADALEHVGPPAGSQSRAPVAGSSWLSSWASPSWSYCNQAWRRSMWVTRDPSRRAICSRSVRLQHRRRTLWR